MDYEKKYKEALERVRRLHDRMLVLSSTDALVASAELEFIFPELTESEDEKIRKGLVKLLTVAGEAYVVKSTGIKKDSYLAWLEKQKEPLPIPDKFSGLKSLMLQYFQSAVHRNDDTEIESDTDLWGRKILDYVWKYSDEQKEQKQEWSEEDEEMLEYVIGDLNDAKQLFSAKDAKDLCDKEIAWLNSLRPSWKPSEEQQSGTSTKSGGNE